VIVINPWRPTKAKPSERSELTFPCATLIQPRRWNPTQTFPNRIRPAASPGNFSERENSREGFQREKIPAVFFSRILPFDSEPHFQQRKTFTERITGNLLREFSRRKKERIPAEKFRRNPSSEKIRRAPE
jgi:hypothetical protein